LTPRNLERLTVDGAAGPIETLIAVPERAPRGIALVCHPHPLQGGTLDNKVVQTLAKAFFALGYVAARFNFRGVGASAGAFDEGRGEEDDVVPLADVFAWARPQQLPIVVFPGCGHFFHGRLPVLARVVTTMWSGAKIREAA
jgi:hypothetical protein